MVILELKILNYVDSLVFVYLTKVVLLNQWTVYINYKKSMNSFIF